MGAPQTITLKRTARGNYYDRRSGAMLTRKPQQMVQNKMVLRKRKRRYPFGRIAAGAAAAIAAKKYRIFNTTLSQKLKKIKKSNAKIEKTVGSTISRFLMMNNNARLAYTDAAYNNAGYGFPLYWTGFPNANLIDDAINGAPAFDIRFMYHRFEGVVCFIPQLPTSKACFFTQGIGATFSNNQRFGLLPNYSEYSQSIQDQGDNFNFNGVAFNQTYGFNANTELATTIVERTNRLRVFRSWIRIELENPNVLTPMKVHILTCKLTCKNFTKGGVTTNEINLNTFMKRNNQDSLVGVDAPASTLIMRLYEDMRRGKLPAKMFKVLKHKTVYLAQKNLCVLDATQLSTIRHNNIKQSGSVKTVRMTFGPKTIYRSHCSAASDVEYSSALIDEQWDKHIFCMMYCEPADFNNHVGTVNTPDVDPVTPQFFPVNYKIFKTNKWKGTNNVN